MIKSRYHWDLAQPTEYITDDLAKKLNLSPIVKKSFGKQESSSRK